jgi:hypothetical protein
MMLKHHLQFLLGEFGANQGEGAGAAKIATLRHGQRADYINEKKAPDATASAALSAEQAAEMAISRACG